MFSQNSAVPTPWMGNQLSDWTHADGFRAIEQYQSRSDGIRDDDLGRLMDGKMEVLYKTFNDSIETGVTKKETMHCYLVPLVKPGKNHIKIQGSCITLIQNTIGKHKHKLLLEKLVGRKLVCQLKKCHLLHPKLGGCSPNRES